LVCGFIEYGCRLEERFAVARWEREESGIAILLFS
jgi:hypothetical protein